MNRFSSGEVEESESGNVVLGIFGGFGGKGRVKRQAVDGDGGFEARVVIGSVFDGGVHR
jgi:hypothetical protein